MAETDLFATDSILDLMFSVVFWRENEWLPREVAREKKICVCVCVCC